MKRVFLHGSPATGKLTVAKALLRMAAGPAQEIIRRFGPGVAQND
jgi:hypothetical protein